jgi:hypothetical protein
MIRVRDAVAEIVDDLSAHQDEIKPMPALDGTVKEDAPLAHIDLAEESIGRNAQEIPIRWRTGKPVLCIPGLGPLDEAFAVIVAQTIERKQIGVRAEGCDALSVSRVFSLDTDGVELVCLCYLANVTSAQIRYSVRRLRRKAPNAFILVTLAGAANVDMKNVFPSSERADLVQQSLSETVTRILSIATSLNKDNELASGASPPLSVASNPSELRAV